MSIGLLPEGCRQVCCLSVPGSSQMCQALQTLPLPTSHCRATVPIQEIGAERTMHEDNGARGRDRTTDTTIFSRMLYQLSYPGIAAATVISGPASDWSRAYGLAARALQAPQSCSGYSGGAGGPGTAYPSSSHFTRSRSRQRDEQNGAWSGTRGLPHIGHLRGLLVMRTRLARSRPRSQAPDRC